MPGLPAPVTRNDELLHALLTELVGLRADLAARSGGEPPAPADPSAGPVEVREPVPSTPRRPRKAQP